ncbi:MAG TPA: TonB-dependent receptor [Vicinamibacterales bacterium]|nr:TonB-dependent receptor [Vicinamibacterales bacterium]
MTASRYCGLIVAACCVLPPGGIAHAQETINFASIGGRVIDAQGAVIPSARVSARQIETNVTAETATNADGRFRFPYLRVGTYELKVYAPGFVDSTRTLSATVGAAFDIPIVLTVSGFEASVTVRGNDTILEAARSQVAGTVPQAEIQNLPMNGRNFLDLALLVPGVSPTNIASTQLFPETSAVPGQGISIASQRNLSNNFIVDGLSANDDAAGLSGIPYGVDAVEQFQVITSGAQAELGRALGGYISVVTKSGTNALRGTIYDFIRDDRFNAPNALSGETLPMDQQQYGASLGGPLAQNRTFFFTNFEQRLLDQTGLVTILPANVPIINNRLTAASYPGSPISTGIYPNPVHSTNGLAKLDHHVSGSDHLTIRYSLYRVTSDNSRGAGALNAPTASAGLDNWDHALGFGNTWTMSSSTVNETRAQFAYGDLEASPADPIGPAVSIAGVASFGTSSSSPTRRLNKLYQLANTLSHQAGAHAFRAGVDFVFNDDTITYPRSARGNYAFSSLASFLTGNYSGYTQTFGDPVVSQTNPNIGLYAQDEWRVGSNLTLNLGLRYDLQFLEPVETDTNNISPRIGFAWSPDSQDLVIRGSAGLFFDRVPLRAVANSILSAGNTTDLDKLQQPSVAGLIPTQAGAPVFPDILPAQILTTTLVDFTTMDRSLRNAYSRQASVEVERVLGARLTASVGYQYVRGNNLLMSVNQNVATCVAAGTNNGCRPISAYRNNNQYSSVAESTYHGLHLSLVQRPTAWASLRGTYTLAKSMNNVGEFFFSSPVDPNDVMRDWGRSDDDQRHRLVINGTVNTSMAPATTAWEHISHGFQVSSFLQYYSSLPFNITSGVVNLQGTTSRPLADGATASANFDVRAVTLIPRNAGIGSDFFSLNLRVSRAFRIAGDVRVDALVEAFNLTNRTNVLTRNTNFGPGAYPTNPASTFNQITAVGDPRTFQFGFRLSF